jgi:hypothetical protein
MRRRIAVLMAAGSLAALAVPVTRAGASSDPVAHSACSRATIGGQSKCIARGQFCAVRYKRDYLRYGLSCSYRDANGRYHLR